MKLKENLHKIIIIIALLVVWAYLLLPVVYEINLRPEFGEILAMGPRMAKIVKYMQTILIGILVSLLSLLILKGCDYYFAKRRSVKERERIDGQVKRYKNAKSYLSSFEDAIAEPYEAF